METGRTSLVKKLLALAVAVSNSGGLGSLPCAVLDPQTIGEQIKAIKAQTSRPFNVNFFCHAAPAPDSDREAAWRAPVLERSRFG